MHEMEEIFDPLRKKKVKLTPEEHVRQWFITLLNKSAGVPITHMMSEVTLRLGKKTFRADIVVYDRALNAVCIVECKEPSVPLDKSVLEQAIRYNMAMEVPYICITNGESTRVCRRRDGSGNIYDFINYLPGYDEMSRAKPTNGK